MNQFGEDWSETNYDFTNTTVEQLTMLLVICSMSEYKEDKNMKKQIQEELNTRLKNNPDLKLDLSFLGEKK